MQLHPDPKLSGLGSVAVCETLYAEVVVHPPWSLSHDAMSDSDRLRIT